MRTIDPTLKAALATFHFVPYFKLKVYRNGAYLTTCDVLKYKLTGTHLTVTVRGVIAVSNAPESIKVILERGIVSNGSTYVSDTSKFTPIKGWIEEVVPKSLMVNTTIEAELIPPRFVSFDGSTSYETVITSFCTAIGKRPVFKNPTAAYWDAQFMPNGTTVTLNNAQLFLPLLMQKHLIFACDNGGEEILFFCAADLPAGSFDASINPVILNIGAGYFGRRRYMATDQNGNITYAGMVGDPLFNIGYKYDGDAFPAIHGQAQPLDFTIPINLDYQDGDFLGISSKSYALYPAQVTEIFDPKASPGWSVNITQLLYFSDTEGGALPSGLAIRSPFMPVNTSMFNGILDASCSNVQSALDKIDDHSHAGAGAIDSVRAKKTAVQTIPSQTLTTLSWNDEDFDANNLHDNVANNSRLTCKTAGKYLIELTVCWGSNNTGVRQLIIHGNMGYLIDIIFPNNNAGEDHNQVFTFANLAVGDYVEGWVWHAAGGNLNVQVAISHFAMSRIA